MNRPNRLQGAFLVCLAVSTLEAQDSDTSLTRTPAFTSSPDAKLQPLPPFSSHRLTGKQILAFPFRGLQNYLSILPGVVLQNGNLHFRGGRADEVGYFIDGFPVTNPFFNSNGVEIIPEAIEELDVATGAYGPEFGRSNAGLVHTRMKTGSDSLQFFFSGQTDNLVSTGSEFWKTTSFGYHNYVGTIGGPVIPGIKFFLAGEYEYFGNRQQMFLEPFRFEGLVTDGLGSRPVGTPLPGPVEFKRNFLDNNQSSKTTIQGNSTIELGDFRVRVTGSYSRLEFPDGGNWPNALQNYFRQRRNMKNEERTSFGGITITHKLSDDISYNVGLSFYDRFGQRSDPDFGDDWIKYPDSLENARKGYLGFYSRYFGPPSYSTIFGFSFTDPSSPNNTYSKNRQSSTTFTANIHANPTSAWKLEAGGEIEGWSIRDYRVNSISGLLSYLDSNNDGILERTFSDEYERRVRVSRAGAISNYGYDYLGISVDEGLDAPRKALFQSAYINNAFTQESATLFLGVRYENLRTGNLVYRKTPDKFSGIWDFPVSQALGVINEYELKGQDPFSFFLPRIGFSYIFGPEQLLYFAYGKYAQLPALNNLYINNITLSNLINPSTRTPYNLGGSVVGFYAGPEKSTQYEVGGRTQLIPGLTLSGQFYYKNLSDQLQLARVYEGDRPLFIAFLNNGEGTARGTEVSLEFQKEDRLFFGVYYSFSNARGRTSFPRSNQKEVTDETLPPIPYTITPYDYDQTQRGSLLASLRFDANDGELLNGFEFSAFATFNSGRRFTRIEPIRFLGSSTPWHIGVRPLLDVRSINPSEPNNASSTPWFFNVDLRLAKSLLAWPLEIELFVNVLNVLNTKNILNVYPQTGAPNDDSWFISPFFQNFRDAAALYEPFYRTINLQNRWSFMGATGFDTYSSPRQIRFGLNVKM